MPINPNGSSLMIEKLVAIAGDNEKKRYHSNMHSLMDSSSCVLSQAVEATRALMAKAAHIISWFFNNSVVCNEN